MRPGEAVMKLTALGYRFELQGGKVRWQWEGPGTPDPGMVRPLLDVVKAHKDEVQFFLRCYCPRCGGVCFISDLEGRSRCMGCEWEELQEIYPGLRELNRGSREDYESKERKS